MPCPRRTRTIAAGVAATMLLLGAPWASADPSLTEAAGLEARFVSSTGWVPPGETYPFTVKYTAPPGGTPSTSLTVTLPAPAVFLSSTPEPSSVAGNVLTYDVGPLADGDQGQLVIRARAMSLTEDPEIVWKDLSATASMTYATLAGAGATLESKTRGPRVTQLDSARYGDRPFPIINVEYQDVHHCNGPGDPFPECPGERTTEMLDAAVNSRTSGKSVWQLYHDMSLGQLSMWGAAPTAKIKSARFTTADAGKYRFYDPTRGTPGGLCTGMTLAPDGIGVGLTYTERVVDGWYRLPGTQNFYGADSAGTADTQLWTRPHTGHVGTDAACGTGSKLAYDAAVAADADLDYNDFDTDRDGVVDFFMAIYAGSSGSKANDSGRNNVWPHSGDLRAHHFGACPAGSGCDREQVRGYISNDQLRDHEGNPLWYTDHTLTARTTIPPADPNQAERLKVRVRVGPYNVNPEPAIDRISVIAHEYGHSLGLPDFYTQSSAVNGQRSTFGTWELMAFDHAQFMTGYARAKLGWIVPREPETDDFYDLLESKTDTHTITWRRPDGTPYTLTGPEVHNADVLRVPVTSGGKDHAYYVELRDRVGWDFDGRNQSERGPATWEPGISVLYTNEERGFGNKGTGDPPVQTPVDARPVPGDMKPDLDDAAFTAAPDRDLFDGCNHFDNYVDPSYVDPVDPARDGLWKLPSAIVMKVTALGGLVTGEAAQAATSPASAGVYLDLQPTCDFDRKQAPTLLLEDGSGGGFGSDSLVDDDGVYTVTWTRPARAIGPDELQESVVLEPLLLEDAEEAGMTNWLAYGDVDGIAWDVRPGKASSGSRSFHSSGINGADASGPIATYLEYGHEILVPAVGSTRLSYHEYFTSELDDTASVQAKDPVTGQWETLSVRTRATGTTGLPVEFLTKPMEQQVVDLTRFAGQAIRVRFELRMGGEDRQMTTPTVGWWVDDIRIDHDDWRTIALAEAAETRYTVDNPSGHYHYRVRTHFPLGSTLTVSPWSNVVSTQVVLDDSDGDGVADQPDTTVSTWRTPAQADGDGDGNG